MPGKSPGQDIDSFSWFNWNLTHLYCNEVYLETDLNIIMQVKTIRSGINLSSQLLLCDLSDHQCIEYFTG